MSKDHQIIEAKFSSSKYLTVCSNLSVHIYSLQPMQCLFSVSGGPFIHATFNNKFLFTVGNSDSPSNSSNFVFVYQKNTGVFVKSIEFQSNILGIYSNSSFLFVSLQSTIQVLEILNEDAEDPDNFNQLSMIECASSSGLIAVTENFILYPDDNKPGIITIATVPGFSVIHEIQCHKDPITMITTSEDGNNMLTASNVGTLLRLFKIEEGCQINEFRRGYRPSIIVAAAANDLMTCLVSPTTLHIFLNDKQHITVSLSINPLACKIYGSLVAIVGVDGILSMYKVDGICGTATLQTQYRLFSAVLTEVSRKRRTSI